MCSVQWSLKIPQPKPRTGSVQPRSVYTVFQEADQQFHPYTLLDACATSSPELLRQLSYFLPASIFFLMANRKSKINDNALINGERGQLHCLKPPSSTSWAEPAVLVSSSLRNTWSRRGKLSEKGRKGKGIGSQTSFWTSLGKGRLLENTPSCKTIGDVDRVGRVRQFAASSRTRTANEATRVTSKTD